MDTQQDISESARQQIAALVQEKMTRSAGRNKMDSRLIYSIKMERGERLAPGLDTLDIVIPRSEEGQPIIDITAKVSKKLITRLEAQGAKILISLPRYNTLRVEMSLEALDAVADFPEVIYIQPMQEAMTSQSATVQVETPGESFDEENLRLTRPGFDERKEVVSNQLLKALSGGSDTSDLYTLNVTGVRKSEADTTQRAAFVRNNYGSDGTGIKIGILSDGVRNLATVQASGDLGPVTVLPGQSGTSAGQCATTQVCDEGTAMLELVHDLAPGAQLYFATAFGTPAAFAQNIRDLRAAGCDIIIDDIFYFAESPFQDGQTPAVISTTNGGVVAQAVNDVTAAGALYFSSAGNSGNKNDNTSGVWEGDFVDGGATAAPIPTGLSFHQFPVDGATPAQNFNVVVTVGSSQYNLNWSDPLGGSGNDYDLYALNAAGTTVVTSSTNRQDGNDDPFEAIAPTAAGTRLVIVKFSGVGRFLRLTTNRGRLTVNTPGQTTGHSTALNAFGVAATPAIGPFPSPHSAANVVETFSSDGPRKLFYQPDGTLFTPGNVSSTGGITRQKPDITAADGVSVTGAGGFGIQFFGTSAAAPHAGAIAALIKSANPSLTPAQIRTTLTSTSIDIEAAGVDRDSGTGIVMADAAFASLGLLAPPAYLSLGTPTVDDVGGNNNDYLDPGEGATVNIPLINTGVATATIVSGTLSSSTPGVTFISTTRTYPDIAANGGTASPSSVFSFVMQPGFVYASDIDFVLTVTYNGGSTQSLPFKIPTGQLADISTTLDTTAPSAGTNYTAATGTQTGRKNFTFPLSACGSTKTAPTNVATGARRYDAFTFTNTSASSICVTALLTHSSNVLVHLNAYLTGFVPATPGTNWVADGGGSSTSGAGTAQRFSFDVPAGATFVLVISESNAGGAPNTPYNLRVTGLPPGAPIAPTAAHVSAGGKVMNAGGQGLANIRVFVTDQTGQRLMAVTNAFGYYRFDNLSVGQTYVFSVESKKRYTFSNSTQVVSLADELFDLNF
ncbi:MAG: S8 family serine peptidase, partial [Pyrinomonadaceae bacterium]